MLSFKALFLSKGLHIAFGNAGVSFEWLSKGIKVRERRGQAEGI